MTRASDDETGFLYIVARLVDGKPCGPVKVGVTNKPTSRLRQLQTASAYRLAFFYVFRVPNKDISQQLESAFHHVMKKRRMNGEWFDMEPDEALDHMYWCFRTAYDYHLKDSGIDYETFVQSIGAPPWFAEIVEPD